MRTGWQWLSALALAVVGVGTVDGQLEMREGAAVAVETLTEDFEGVELDAWALVDGAGVERTQRGAWLVLDAPAHALWRTVAGGDFTLRCRMKAGDGSGLMLLRVTEGAYYSLILRAGAIELERTDATGTTKLGSGRANLGEERWHKVDVTAGGGAIHVRADGRSVLDATDPDPLPDGMVGFGCVAGSPWLVDDVAFTPTVGAEAGIATPEGDAATPIHLPDMAGTAGQPANRTDVPGTLAPPDRQVADLGNRAETLPGVRAGGERRDNSRALLPQARPDQSCVFVRVDGVDGEATDDQHKRWIEAMDCRYELRAEAVDPGPGVLGLGKTLAGPVVITKLTDAASPRLHFMCGRGEMTTEATVEVMCPGTDTAMWRMELEEVRIAGIRIVGVHASGRLIEEVSLAYLRIKWIHAPRSAAGAQGSSEQFWWDVRDSLQ